MMQTEINHVQQITHNFSIDQKFNLSEFHHGSTNENNINWDSKMQRKKLHSLLQLIQVSTNNQRENLEKLNFLYIVCYEEIKKMTDYQPVNEKFNYDIAPNDTVYEVIFNENKNKIVHAIFSKKQHADKCIWLTNVECNRQNIKTIVAKLTPLYFCQLTPEQKREIRKNNHYKQVSC